MEKELARLKLQFGNISLSPAKERKPRVPMSEQAMAAMKAKRAAIIAAKAEPEAEEPNAEEPSKSVQKEKMDGGTRKQRGGRTRTLPLPHHLQVIADRDQCKQECYDRRQENLSDTLLSTEERNASRERFRSCQDECFRRFPLTQEEETEIEERQRVINYEQGHRHEIQSAMRQQARTQRRQERTERRRPRENGRIRRINFGSEGGTRRMRLRRNSNSRRSTQ